MIIGTHIPSGRILDAGCGTGKLLAYLAMNGFDCAGCDFSANMLKKARQNLGSVSAREIPLIQTALDNLSMFADRSFDHVFCLGVFPYISEDKESRCYRELRRVIRPGGYFITAHTNEIFDAFTFNKYTIRFFERNLWPLLQDVDAGLNLEGAKTQLSSLIVNPDKPVNTEANRSARDLVFMKPENPLLYPEKIASFGFANREIRYYHFHALPPLLRDGNQELLNASKKMEIRFSSNWQGMFMASTFLSIAQAVDA
ncbi:MAG: class I SAM-dependent methyltransferase [Victivallales bacterium]